MTTLQSSARTINVVWAGLVLATVVTFAVGGEHAIDSRNLATAVVIAIAAIKIRLVGIHFMEIKDAPLALRAVFEAYCAGLFVVLTVLYLVI
ncbi:MAG: cytochrome C oxidase subunit IV family protein [Sporichthyaceae bacterium]